MDKILMKAAFLGIGLPCVPYIYFDRNAYAQNKEQILEKVEAKVAYPVFIKPANLGSSIGISKAKNREELANAIEIASHYDRRILAEQGVNNLKEINCSAMGFGGEVTASVCEMPVAWEEFLSYDDKYMRGGKSSKNGNDKKEGMAALARQIPAPISAELTKRIQDYTIQAFELLDCKGVVRIDYLYDTEREELYINEINTIPGSFAYYLWEPLGISYSQLLDKLIDYAYKANDETKASEYAFNSEILKKYQVGKQGNKLAGSKTAPGNIGSAKG
jgi:D-alanine-D-alanine ligase